MNKGIENALFVGWLMLCTTTLLLGCSKRALDVKHKYQIEEQNVYSISPDRIVLNWNPVENVESYELTDRDGNFIEKSTLNRMELDVVSNSDYEIILKGRRGTQYKTPEITNWEFKTWKSFEDVVISVENEEQAVSVSWNYSPWDELHALRDDLEAMSTQCTFSAQDEERFTLSAPTQEGVLKAEGTYFNPTKNYGVKCSTTYADNTVSASSSIGEILPKASTKLCEAIAYANEQFTCNVELKFFEEKERKIELNVSDSSCEWLKENNGTFVGLPGEADLGQCYLKGQLSAEGYSSVEFEQSIEVKKEPDYQIYPSFAVRGLSGALTSFDFENSFLRRMDDGEIVEVTSEGCDLKSSDCVIPDESRKLSQSRVEGTILTDLGIGNKFFLGGEKGVGVSRIGSGGFYSIGVRSTLDVIRKNASYNHIDNSPDSDGQIKGALVLPSLVVESSIFENKVSLMDIINLRLYRSKDQLSKSYPELNKYLVDGEGTKTKVFEKNFKIQSPKVEFLEKYISTANASVKIHSILLKENGKFQSIKSNVDLGMTLQNEFLKGESEIHCSGDIILTAPLVLKNVKVITGDSGCRIYSTNTIFLKGKIEVQGPHPNLQLSSTTAIIIGFNKRLLGVNELGERVSDERRGFRGVIGRFVSNEQNNPFLTSISSTPQLASGHLDKIAADVFKVSSYWEEGYSSFPTGSEVELDQFEYKGIMLHAPIVLNNYSRSDKSIDGLNQAPGIPFEGGVIAEVLWFKELNFKVDTNRFLNEPIFPLYSESERPILLLKD